nr:MAG TPA: B3 domain-containing transcription repressor [Caudoviricetes sp.]
MIFCETFHLDYVLAQWYDITITKQKNKPQRR